VTRPGLRRIASGSRAPRKKPAPLGDAHKETAPEGAALSCELMSHFFTLGCGGDVGSRQTLLGRYRK
jgi:hypothetical protein